MAYKYVTIKIYEIKYDKTETKQIPTTRNMNLKTGRFVYTICLNDCCREVMTSGRCCCQEVKIRMNVWTFRRNHEKWPLQGESR